MLEANSLSNRINFTGDKKHKTKVAVAKTLCVAASFVMVMAPNMAMAASDPSLNFKIYSPQEPPAAAPAAKADAADSGDAAAASAAPSTEGPKSIFEEAMPQLDTTQDKPAGALAPNAGPEDAAPVATPAPAATPAASAPAAADAATTAASPADAPAAEAAAPATEAAASGETTTVEAKDGTKSEKSDKTLQGYIRVVPSGTKIPIIMDTAVDSDTSQESDEFSARTSEDLLIDGNTVVPAGSVIKGRIAQLNAPKAMNRSGSVALKFDTITTPDNRQIPLVANIVAHGGVVHARRGMKDIAIDTAAVSIPALAGLAIGYLAGKNNTSTVTTSGTTTTSHVTKAKGAMIGVGVGLAVGVVILLAKKGKKVEVRPGDELKIELAEDLRMPTM